MKTIGCLYTASVMVVLYGSETLDISFGFEEVV